MDHAITAHDVIAFLLAVGAGGALLAIFLYVLSVVAGGYNH